MNKKACESQLQDEPFYKKIDKYIYRETTITEKVNDLFIDKLITRKELNFLTEYLASLRTQILYGLPKIHV